MSSMVPLLVRSYTMPWRSICEIRRIVSLPIVRTLFKLNGIAWGENWHIYGVPIFQVYRGSKVAIGSGLTLRSWPCANPLVPNHPVVIATRSTSASIVVGRNCGFTGVTLVAEESISIGNSVLIGSNTTIVDTDFHPLDAEARRVDVTAGEHKPVTIEDDVFIGMNCLILKGLTIGRGAVVGAGSVVTRSVAPGERVAGNPARPVGAVHRLEQRHSSGMCAPELDEWYAPNAKKS